MRQRGAMEEHVPDLAELIHTYGLLAVGTGTFLEGESVLLLAGAAAARGHLSLPAVIVVATLAGFAGDQLFFWVGRRWGGVLLARFPSLQPGAGRMNALLDRYHTPLILAVRFLYGLRVAGPIVIGMSHVPWHRFLILNLIGAALWAPLIASLGYGTGHALASVLRVADADELWALALLIVVGTGVALLARWRLRRRL